MRAIPKHAWFCLLLAACAGAPDDADTVRVHGDHLELRDQAALDRLSTELSGMSLAELDTWEARLAPFESARRFYDRAAPTAADATGDTAPGDLLIVEPDGSLELDLPRGRGLERIVNARGVIGVGGALIQYRRGAIKQITDGDEATLAVLDQIHDSTPDGRILVERIDSTPIALAPRGERTSRFVDDTSCTGYTPGEGQRVQGFAEIHRSMMVDVNGVTNFPGEIVCRSTVEVFARNQIKGVFGWQLKPTGQLRAVGAVYLYSPNISEGPYSQDFGSSGTQTTISRMIFDSGWWRCTDLPNATYPIGISGYLEFYGRDGSYCSTWGLRRDHFYTTSVAERDNAVSRFGYANQGPAAYIYSFQASGTTPLYRLLSSDNYHFYTIFSGERDAAVASGNWISEGIAGYVYSSPASGTTPLYRLANGPIAGREHVYMTDAGLRDYYVAHYGFISEGIAAHVYSSQVSGTTPLYELIK